jgi:hypothetical protein
MSFYLIANAGDGVSQDVCTCESLAMVRLIKKAIDDQFRMQLWDDMIALGNGKPMPVTLEIYQGEDMEFIE